jgi:hypothetical protein
MRWTLALPCYCAQPLIYGLGGLVAPFVGIAHRPDRVSCILRKEGIMKNLISRLKFRYPISVRDCVRHISASSVGRNQRYSKANALIMRGKTIGSELLAQISQTQITFIHGPPPRETWDMTPQALEAATSDPPPRN